MSVRKPELRSTRAAVNQRVGRPERRRKEASFKKLPFGAFPVTRRYGHPLFWLTAVLLLQTTRAQAAVSILTTNLYPSYIQQPYSAVLSATGGTAPYSWSLTGGQLPTGLSLNSTSGKITGTPSQGGAFSLTVKANDSAGASTSKTFNLVLSSIPLDIYGGTTLKTCSSATGYFHTEKLGNRWWLCDPAGNVYWMSSIGGIYVLDDGCDATTGQCGAYHTTVYSKYGDLPTWGAQQNRRMQSWGFNSVGQLTTGWLQPFQTCPGCAGWPNGQQPVKMPTTQTLLVSNYAAVNLNNYASRPTKDMLAGLNTNYRAWRATIMDFFDSAFYQFIDQMVGNDPGVTDLKTSPWMIGVFLDDTDWFWGMGAGPDFHTVPMGHNNADPGYMAMITSPLQVFNPNPAGRGVPEMYDETRVFTKTGNGVVPPSCSAASPCSLRDYLYNTYGGNISALNSAWGSNYTTFDSAGTSVNAEVIGTGDGVKKTFTKTLAQAPVSPLSVRIRQAGASQAGDCPWWNVNCHLSTPNMGTIMGGVNSTVLNGAQPWLAAIYGSASASIPALSIGAIITYHYPSATGLISTPSREVGENFYQGGQQPHVPSPQPDSTGQATGYDVYAMCRLDNGTSPGLGCAANGAAYPAYQLQASNVPFGTDWAMPTTGLVAGQGVPPPPNTVNYVSGQLVVSFTNAPPAGTPVTVDYVTGGWMYGSGLMDEDGRHSAWLGTNAYCLQAATACDGKDLPVVDANANVAKDLDGWTIQLAAQYFRSCRNGFKNHAPNIMYLGADTIGAWWVPTRKEILQGASTYVDILFTSWAPDQPNAATGLSSFQYQSKYFGDKPMMNFLTLEANPDSALYRYPDNGAVFGVATQGERGQLYANWMQAMLQTPGYYNTYPWVGSNWWGLADYWNEKFDWGLVTTSDNAYDCQSAAVSKGADAWGYSTGGEEKTYGDAITPITQANFNIYPSLLGQPLMTFTSACGPSAPPGSPCDLNADGSTNVVDVQQDVNVALGIVGCSTIFDINKDGACNVVDVQRVVNAALGGLCVSP